MKNIFLKSKAKSLQKTGGGDSQKNVHHLGVASEMPPRCLRDASVSIYSCQSDFSTRVWKYAACLLLAFFVGIGNVWAANVPAAAGTYSVVGKKPGNANRFYKLGNGVYVHRINNSSWDSSMGMKIPSDNENGVAVYLSSSMKVSALINKKSDKNAVNVELKAYPITNGSTTFDAFEAGSDNSTEITVTRSSTASYTLSTSFAKLDSKAAENKSTNEVTFAAGYYYIVGTDDIGTTYLTSITLTAASGGGGSTYDITYHCNGGVTCPSDLTEQTALPATLATLTKSNYTWGGWYTDAAFSSAASASAPLTANADLYAKFTQSITLDREGGSDGSSSVTATYNSATLPSITNPTKDGYMFAGWYDGDDGTGNLVINTSGALQANVSGYTGAGGIWTSSTARTLHAKWEDPIYEDKIVWSKNTSYGGDGKCMSADDANSSSLTKNNNSQNDLGHSYVQISSTNTGMDRPAAVDDVFTLTFTAKDGYYIQSICSYGKIEETGGAYYSWDGGSNWTNIARYASMATKTFDAPDATEPTSFIIKYTCTNTGSGGMYWRNAVITLGEATPANYTLSYNANGGSGDAMANTVGTGTQTLRTNTYTKAGCSFIGWATSQANANAGTVAYADEANNYNLSADATLYAVWKLNTPAISCENNVVTITVPGSSTVYYTTDGSTTPTSGSTAYDPSNKPVIAETTTFKAIAILANHVSSDVATQECVYVAPAPPSTKRIYMKCGSTWCDDVADGAPKFFVHSWGSVLNDAALTLADCETDVYYADIPASNTSLIFTRQKAASTERVWEGDPNFVNKSVDITIGDNDLFTCSGWSDGKGTFSAGTYAAPTYTISFAGNGNTDGEMSAISSLACGANQAITANAFVKAGYSFANWTANVAVTIGDETVSAGSAIAGGATIQNITSDIALTAQWIQAVPTSVSVDGTWRCFPGQTISLTATPTGGTSDFTYQWQKYVTNAWQDIEGANEDTYTKANCTISDCGSYRCVVSKLGGSVESNAFDVHIYTLNGNYNGSEWVSNDLTVVSGTTGKVELTLEAGRLYKFKVKDNFANYWFGNAGYMLKSETGWTCPNNESGDIRVFTGAAGTYTFTVDIAHVDYGTPEVAVSVTYPSVTHPIAGYVYYDKGSNDWENVAAHWWKNEGTIDFVAWNSDPWLTQSVEICGTTYYYMPKLEGYDRLIFHKPSASGDGNQTPDITVDASSSGKYISGNDAEWKAFAKYTISFAGNGNTSGEMSAIENICPASDQALTANAFAKTGHNFTGWVADVDVTVGESTITAGNTIADEATIEAIASNITLTAQWEIDCPTEGTVYSLLLKDDVENASLEKNGGTLNLTSTHVTVTNGASALIKNTDTGNDGKMQIKSHQFYFNGNNAYLKIEMLCALEAGDEIEMTGGKDSREFYITPNECAKPSDDADAVKTSSYKYTVKATDTKLVGVSTLYIGRDGSGTYTTGVKVTRPEKFDVTYWKNDGSDASTVATDVAVVAANEFTRSGYRFIEWNTQADGNGTTKAVGAAVTANIELYAIWAQEYSVSYANTGAASGAAPTNENKYIAGETFKVAGVGSMVAAENYAFGGWDDGSNIYAEDDDYTVGSANVSFTPVWNLHYTVTYKANGGTGSDIVVDNPAKVADCVFETPENKLFDKWNASAEGDGANYAVGADVSSSLILYAIWKDDECSTNRKSIFKAVLTGDATATVTGENGKEYAGDALLNKLGGSDSNRNTDATIEGVGSGLTTYKMNGTGAYMYGTLKKGAFQEGDKIQFAVSSTPGTLAIYGTKSSDLSQRVHIADMPAPNAAKVFTYTLTAANATALAGYDAIGIYRADGVTMNPFLYSLEITGCRVWTITHDVTFDMKSHGTQVEKQTLEVGAKVTEPAEPEAAGYIFGGWYKETTLENKWNFSTDVVPDNDITLYAKWTEDPCTDRQSLSKVVLTSASAGTVTGYNSNEYAGTELIAGLSSSKSADLGDGSVTGYKLNNGGSSMLMATLKKGNFQEGDKVTIGIVYQNDQRTVDDSKNIMTIYAGSDASHMMEVTTLTGVTGAGYYTYRLTAADAAAINEAGYKSIGLFRASSNGQNHYVYSVEITGCRDWAVSHTVTFNKMGKGADIASISVVEGDKVTKPTVVEPEGWALAGWYKEEGLVNEWDFDVDVMGEENITLYAKWEDESGAIKLFDGEGNLNTTNFVSPAKTTIEIDEVEYPCLAEFSSNRTSLAGATPSDMVQYNATTDEAKIKMTFYNSNSGVKKAILYKYEEGAEEPVKIEIEVPGQEIYTTEYYEFNSSKNRSFYVCMNDRSNIRVLQIKVMDNGTTIQKAGQAGYVVTFNKGRMYVKNGEATPFEGMTMNTSSEYKVFNNSNIATTSNFSFTTTVDKMVLRVTRAGGNYYVSQNPASKGTIYNKNQEIVLTPAGTWYIGSETSGSAASFSKIEFIAPKCEAPAFNALANSDICSGDAYVALDGTGTVSDGGSITYKWYAQGDAETVLATTATYMPEADGSYYVVALHHVDGYTDNEVTSDVVTVTTHAGTAITEGLVDLRGAIDDVVTLSVDAEGANLHYTWKECATIDGTYTDVAGAADAASLEVTVTEGMSKYYKVIVHSDCGDDLESIAHVTQFVPVVQQDVTSSIIWDWTKAASVNEIKLTDSTTPKKNDGFVMANGAATVYNNANFESDKLYLEGEYIVRDGKYFQGQMIKFNTTTAGLIRVKFSHTGNNKPARELYINGVGTGDSRTSATAAWSRYVEVPAGEVSITSYFVDPTEGTGIQYIRVPQIEFYALDKVRDDSWIAPRELGTVCYPNGHIVIGADMYKMAGVNENGKFAFDQVDVTEPGVPYLFEATGYEPIKFYKTTAATAEEAGTSNGMVGTFVDKTLTPAEGENLYYFQGTHFYSVAERTKNLSVPANRCYVDLNEPHPAAAPKAGVRRIVFGVNGTNSATGIESISDEGLEMKGAQKMLINGKIYILRGEKMYDATGRLVK